MGKINSCTLKFVCGNNRLKFSTGLFLPYIYIQCDKVAIVHTNKNNENMEIIIVTKGKIKNKKMKKIQTPKDEEIEKTLHIALEMYERGFTFLPIDLYKSSKELIA